MPSPTVHLPNPNRVLSLNDLMFNAVQLLSWPNLGITPDFEKVHKI